MVSIKDNGTGIDPQIFPELFKKFATKSEQGTGLGLYISKNIIEAHGGKCGEKTILKVDLLFILLYLYGNLKIDN